MPQQIENKEPIKHYIILIPEEGMSTGHADMILCGTDNTEKAIETFNRIVIKGEPLYKDHPKDTKRYNRYDTSLLVQVIKRTDLLRDDFYAKIETTVGQVKVMRSWQWLYIADCFHEDNATNEEKITIIVRGTKNTMDGLQSFLGDKGKIIRTWEDKEEILKGE
jgi:hypothetical protein